MAATVAFATIPTVAQTPSVDDIINRLKPSANQLGGATRGVRPLGTAAAREPAAPSEHPRPPAENTQAANRPVSPAPSAPAASESSGHRSIDLTLEFRTGSAMLTPEAAEALDNLGRALASDALAGYRFRIAGHTDTVGDPDSNQRLSEARAQTVATYLEQHYGIAPARLETVGRGSQDLAVPTGPQVPEIRNRRVQVLNLDT